MSDSSSPASGPGSVPFPYISFKTLMGLLDKLAGGPIPPRIDKTVLDTYSGGTVAIILSTLRMLGLIREDGTKTDALEPFIKDEEFRKKHLREFMERTYAPQLELAGQHGTAGQLLESFAAVKGTDTKRKVILFYLAGVEYLGLPNSTRFKAPKQAAATAPRNKRTGRRGADNDGGDDDHDEDEDEEPTFTEPTGEKQVVDLGEAGTITIYVDVKALKMPPTKFASMHDALDKLAKLGPAGLPPGGDQKDEDDQEDDP